MENFYANLYHTTSGPCWKHYEISEGSMKQSKFAVETFYVC